MYRVFKLPIFDKRANKLFNNLELIRIDKIIVQLKINPFIGKSLSYQFFREKRVNGKRIYFLIYVEIKIVLLVSSSNKKFQQEIIEEIKLYFDDFKDYVYQL